MEIVARSGFRHARVCNDCNSEIGGDGRCKCATTTPFHKGARVTICADEAGEVPVAIGSVARIGNGAFRVSLTGDWYDIVSGRAKKGASGARARVIRDGDEEIVRRKKEDAARRNKLATLSADAFKERCSADTWRRRSQSELATAARSEREATGIMDGVKLMRGRATEYDRLATAADDRAKAIALEIAQLSGEAPR